MTDTELFAPTAPPRRRALRVFLLLSVLGVVALVAVALWQEKLVPRAVEVAVRDYLYTERVEGHADVLREASAESGVDAYLLAGIMVSESSGRVDAKSTAGALGLFQLMPVTARWRAEKLGLPEPTEDELLSDPLLNARLGADNVAWLLRTYDGDVERALVAYNLGAGKLKKYVDAAGSWDAWRQERAEAGNSDLLAYAAKVMAYRDRFRDRRLLDEKGKHGQGEDAR